MANKRGVLDLKYGGTGVESVEDLRKLIGVDALAGYLIQVVEDLDDVAEIAVAATAKLAVQQTQIESLLLLRSDVSMLHMELASVRALITDSPVFETRPPDGGNAATSRGGVLWGSGENASVIRRQGNQVNMRIGIEVTTALDYPHMARLNWEVPEGYRPITDLREVIDSLNHITPIQGSIDLIVKTDGVMELSLPRALTFKNGVFIISYVTRDPFPH